MLMATADFGHLKAIEEKVYTGERLTLQDGLALEDCRDLLFLGELANHVRERLNGNFAYFNVNTHINPTNVCVYKCDFCAFRADLDDPRGYVMDESQIRERAREAHNKGATELHIVGGLHHKLPFSYYTDVVKWVTSESPEIHVKAYTAVEIEFFAKIARKPMKQILEELVDSGLGSLPGGGAEIFHPEVREKICDAKFTDIVQVSQDDLPVVKEEMGRQRVLGTPISIEEHLAYKYLVDVDGNSCTYSRLYWILKSNSLCLKHLSNEEQWYYKGLEPYVHYIPFKEDFSDLEEKILWAKNHNDQVKKIILSANEFANQSLKHSDALFYFYKVLERYQKLLD